MHHLEVYPKMKFITSRFTINHVHICGLLIKYDCKGEKMEVEQAIPQLREVGAKTSVLGAPITTVSELFSYRFLVRNLIRREVRGRYRNAMLGYFWTVIEPALLAVVYWFLFVMLAGRADEMYPVWVLLGVITWGCFGKSLSASVNSLTGNARTIHLVYFPRTIFPVTAVGANVVISLMGSLVIIPVLYFYQIPPTIHLIWVPIGIFLSGLMALGFGMMMAPLNCVQRDVAHFTRFLTRAGFFFSPVMWTAEMAMERGVLGAAALWNPMAIPITMVRHGVMGKSIDIPMQYVYSSLISIVLFWILGAMIFNKYERGAVKYL